MSAPKLPDTVPRTSFTEAYLDHVKTAMDRTLAACGPRCACGAAAEPFGATPRCIRCELRVSAARSRLRTMRDEALLTRAHLGDADAEAELHVLEEQERERDAHYANGDNPDYLSDIERDRSAEEG